MKSELESGVYMPPAAGSEETLVDIKDYIRYFDKIRDTVTAHRRPGTIETGRDWDARLREAAEPVDTPPAEPPCGGADACCDGTDTCCDGTDACCDGTDTCCDDVASTQDPAGGAEAGPKSKIELLKEQIFKASTATYRDQERIEEAERLCKMKRDGEEQGEAPSADDAAGAEIDSTADTDSLNTCDLIEFDLKLSNKINEMHEADLHTDDDLLDTKKPSSEAPSLEMKDIATESPFAEGHSSLKDSSKLPRSMQIISDFYNFGSRPAIFKCPELTCVERVRSRNLYTDCTDRGYSTLSREKTPVPLFSDLHLRSEPHVFRSPGTPMGGKPLLSIHGSVVSEGGVLHYISVVEGPTSWCVRKDLSPYMNAKSNVASAIDALNDLPDHRLSVFILSDIVTTVFRRSSYVFYGGGIALLKFVGRSLCICLRGRCLDIILLDDATVLKVDSARPGLVVNGHAFECSCTAERDEWYGAVAGLVHTRH